jgi:transcriptional regulator with XRE-family HTH domain
MTIGKEIRAARLKKKLTQPDLASTLGKSVRMIQSYESDEVTPSFEIVEQIATALGVNPVKLLGWEQGGAFLLRTEDDTLFDRFVETLGFTVVTELLSENPDEIANASIGIIGGVLTPPKHDFHLSRGKEQVTFSDAEYKEMQNTIKDVIEAKYYKKVIEAKGARKKSPKE